MPHGPVVPTPRSRARLWPLGDATLDPAGLLGSWQARNREETLPHCIAELERTGAVENLRRLTGASDADYGGFWFSDSDVYKTLEGAAWEGSAWTGEIAPLLAAAQGSDGYLNSWVQGVHPEKRWKELEGSHELYCLGHLIQAGIAHARTSGRTEVLEVATRFADLVVRDGQDLLEGHPEPEMALVELYRETGDEAYLALAGRMLERRGRGHLGGGRYLQDDAPVREATEATGHAVRQLYLACGAVDVYLETGDETLLDAMRALWHSAFQEKTYVTGGPGSRHAGEAFGEPYELPPGAAYAETCAAIAGLMLNWRLLLATGEAQFADELERALYNGIAAGISAGGRAFFYSNPLEVREPFARQAWWDCACCPTNVVRLLASLQHYVATGDEGGVQLHLYAAGTFGPVRVRTDYPWDGRVEIEASRPVELALRIPGWCRAATIRTGAGDPRPAAPGADGYARVAAQAGDRVVLDLDLPVRLVSAHPRVEAVRGCVALARGPLVYCAEQIDHDVPLDDLRVDPARPPRADGERLTGAALVSPAGDGGLYRDFAPTAAAGETRLVAVPYFSWANREPGPMRVWMPI